MKKNTTWFSLPLAMWLVILISLLAMTMLEYIIPFWRDIKWVENSSIAYYMANSWVEEWLYNVYSRNNSWSLDDRTEFSDTDFTGMKNTQYSTISAGKILPPNGEWNSEFHVNWNTISIWDPIQVPIWENWMNLSQDDFQIQLRVPNLDGIGTTNETLDTTDDIAIVNWQLSAQDDSLNSISDLTDIDRSIFIESDVDGNYITLDNQLWKNLSWAKESFIDFYNDHCNTTDKPCSIKFSVVNDLLSNDGITVPYLEWRIRLNTTSTRTIPLRFTQIETSWKSYGYKKDIKVKVASNTVNEAFDFTVFQ